MSMSCLVCERIHQIKHNKNPCFVKELSTGYVVIGDHQRFRGYTLFLCKEHATELHFLPRAFKLRFLEEMSLVAEAVYKAFRPEKLNYELLGMGCAHLHWHIFPRVAGDTPTLGPIWRLPYEEIYSDSVRPSEQERREMITQLQQALENILKGETHD